MSRFFKTKKEILRLLSIKAKTLMDISKELELSPSTVCEHLKDLKASGTIEVADSHSRKWKYYRICALGGVNVTGFRYG